MKIRLAQPDEAQECWRIRNHAIQYGCKNFYDAAAIKAWTPQRMPMGFTHELIKNPFFVAQNPDGKLLTTGFLGVSTASIEAVFTLPSHMGMGLGTQIIDAIKIEAQKRNFKKLTLASTPNATAFYQKNGFVVVAQSLHFSKIAQTHLHCVQMMINL